MLIIALLLAAQAAGPPAPDSVLGEVTAVEAQRIILRTDAGTSVLLGTDEKTAILRSQPGARSLSGAVAIPRSDIAAGDRVLARGTWSSDRAVLSAARLIVMKRADIEVKREAEREEWRRRGIGGLVTALEASTQELTVRLRGASNGAATVRVPTAGREVLFRRYAPSSVRFSDARPSAFEELRVGDQVRMLGERSEDGATFVPEQIVSGAFRTLQGAILRVDPGRGELAVRVASDDGPPMTVTVAVGPDVRLHRLPAAGGPGGAGPPRGNLDEMLDRLPRITLTELASGEGVAVLGTRSDDVSRLNAMKLVAGLPAPDSQAVDDHGERGGSGGEGTDEGGDRLGFGGELPW